MTEIESEQPQNDPPTAKKGGSGVKKEELEEVTTYSDGMTQYNVGDTVYIESQRPDMPYFICTVRNFNRNKKNHISVDVVWFYRPCEIPTSVYQLLLQDRHTENGSNILDDPIVKSRELFISDAIDVYPASALRGHAVCVPFSEIKENVPEFIKKENNWFYILRYNPESRRMANAKGEIRIGISHQACPPPYNANRESKEAQADLYSTCCEELVWKPTLPKSKLMVYLRAARSITSFNGYCETEDGCPEKALNALSEDQNTAHSYNVLHKNNYNISVALQELIRSPTPKKVTKPWTDDDRKRFMRGLRSYGKTFHKIRKECLPERETSELVTYYYIWKKTAIAINSRPHKRGGRRNNVLARKTRTTKPKTTEASEFLDLSSCSENDMDDTDDSENARDLSLYACRHCYSTKSPNWHHGGKDKLLLCYSCRMYFKRYGCMKPLSLEEKREPPPFIFKAAFENLDDSALFSGRMRTRRSSTPVFTNANSLRSRLVQEAKVGNRKQVTAPANPESYSDKEDKEDTEVEVSNVMKRKSEDEEIDAEGPKKRRESDATDAGEDADDESEGDSETGSRAEADKASAEDSLQSPTPDNNAAEAKAAASVSEKSDITDASTVATTTVSTAASGNLVPKQECPTSESAMTFMPIKQENEASMEDNADQEPGSPDSTPDVPDDEEKLAKIKQRFVHNETEAGNSCARCEMYYIHKRPKKQRPTELDTSKRKEDYLQGKNAIQKRTPPPSHQPAQITSHYETMRLFAEAARSAEPQRYWSSYQVPPEMQHGHRPHSPREFIGEHPAAAGGKYGHLLEALDRPVDLRSPRSNSVPGHPPGPHGNPHGFPPRSEGGRDFRINQGPGGRAHLLHHGVPPASLENISRIPPGEGGPPIGERGDPRLERTTIDPITGLPTIQPHLHSHHHTHTHLHVHPDELKHRSAYGHAQPPPEAHFERHERATPHQTPHPTPHPTQPPVAQHRPNSRSSREYHEHLLKQYPDLLAQMHHDSHLRESISRHIPPGSAGVSSAGPGNPGPRETMLHPARDGAVSPSIPHDIPNAHSDPVAYHLWVTQYANMQRWNSHGNGPPSHAQAPELSPHGIPAPPRLPHDIRNEHEKHMKEKLLYAHEQREKLARAEHFRSLEHEKHLRSMLQGREHLESVKMKNDQHLPPPPDHHAYKQGGGPDMHGMPYHSNNAFIDTLRRAHDTRVSSHERNFHEQLRFGHERMEQRERPPNVHPERQAHPADRFTDRSRHERPSIFGSYKPETIDLSED